VQQKQIERLRSLFKFCVENEWLKKNPAKALELPQLDPRDKVEVFTEEESDKINATINCPIMWAFVLTLEHTGLRISDAVQLQKQLIKDGKFSILTKKKKVRVEIPVRLCFSRRSIKSRRRNIFSGAGKAS
jgi:site-specific recombinase XerD